MAIQERDVRADAEHGKRAQGRHRSRDRRAARLAGGDELGEHRIVLHRHVGAFLDAAVDADAGARGLAIQQQRSGLRQETRRRVLGVDAAFDGVSALGEIVLAPRQRAAGRDVELRS